MIPVIVSITFLIMSFFGVMVEQVSLAALIIALGMLVDNAIVVSESIIVKMEHGKDAETAAVESTSELVFPLLISSLTTWSTALAAPQMNEAKRNHTIDSVAAAWMNNPKAIAKMMNERAIVFL
jgi:preprotein translocase subunit SecF